jgi:hypothetical protein
MAETLVVRLISKSYYFYICNYDWIKTLDIMLCLYCNYVRLTLCQYQLSLQFVAL